ncbi:MAG: hypothetical protein HOV68_12090 [Streptomycetaceae bacterium]|nr:hypothetical protein [Streptomycetaceae bacterium]
MYARDLPLLSLTFAHGLTPSELLARMGADPDTVAVRDRRAFDAEFGPMLFDDDAYVVVAGRCGEWAWAEEPGSWRCVDDDDLVRRASEGTRALVLHTNEKPMFEFRYAEDGRLVTGICTLLSMRASDRSGCDPHRFDADMRAAGADPEASEYGPLGHRGLFFRLAENLGVGVPEAGFGSGEVSGRLRGR